MLVLPFVNLTGDPADDWIGAGVAEALAAGLPAGTAIVARRGLPSAADAPADAPVPVDEAVGVGRALDARFVLVGAYQRFGSRLRITARVVSAAGGEVVRSAIVDGAAHDLFDLQDRVLRALSSPAMPTATTPVAAPAPRNVGDVGTPPAAAPVARAPAPLPAVAASAPAVAPGAVAPGGFAASSAAALAPLIDGPPAPVAPEVMTRDEDGGATVRAIRLDGGLRLDGVLDEPVYETVPPITGFIQQLPDPGAPATERTEAWITFDETNVYVSARVWDSAPESRWVANEMRRDTTQLRQNDTFTAFFDTFYDRRNGFNFYTNPLGARSDSQFTNEGNPNNDWNPVWDVRTGRFAGGWTVEMEIPFKTLPTAPSRPTSGASSSAGPSGARTSGST